MKVVEPFPLSDAARSFYVQRPVLVTGGLGFIGSNLVHALAKIGARVTVLDNLNPKYGGNQFNLNGVEGQVELINADQGEEKVLQNVVGRFDSIFNMVGQVSHIDSMEDPYADLYTNVRVHIALLEACRKVGHKPKVVFAGTRGQYGRANGALKRVNESAPIAPVDVNGVNKHAGEMYHFLYSHAYGLRSCSLRLTNTYGPRHTMKTSRQGVIAWFVRQALDGQEVQLFGGGDQLRDCNHVADVASALLLAMFNPAADGEVFNLGSEEPMSLLRIVERIVAVAEKGSVKHIPYPEHLKAIEIGDYAGDYSKIQKILGWLPSISLDTGLAEMVDYYRRNRDHYWRA